MKSASYYAAYIVKKLWTVAAVLLVFVAVSISLLRYTLPYLDEQKHQVEDYLSAEYGVDLAIGELSAGWSGIGPTLVLRDVELKQNERSPIGLSIAETQVELDFWGTVLSQQILSRRFDLSGLTLEVDLVQIRQADSDFPIVDALQNLFLQQLQHFNVSDSQIEITTRNDEQLIDVQQLSWVNQGEKHQGVGKLRVVELANNSAFFGLNLRGSQDNLNGTFYASGAELDLTPWINQWFKTQYDLTESRGNFVFWAGIEQSRVTGVQVELSESQFKWSTPSSDVLASVLGGELRAVPSNQGWDLNLDNLILQAGGNSLVSSWSGRVNQEGHLFINSLQPVNIAALVPIAPTSDGTRPFRLRYSIVSSGNAG